MTYLFLSIFMSSIFFLFYINFAAYSLMYFLILYLITFLLLLKIGAEILALFLILIYVGGVLVLFMFTIFFFESGKGISKNLIHTKLFFYFFIAALFLLYFSTNFLMMFDISPLIYTELNFDILLFNPYIIKKYLWLYSINKSAILGFSHFSHFSYFSSLYISFYWVTVMVFIIFFVSLIGVVVVTSKSYDYFFSVRCIFKSDFYKKFSPIYIFIPNDVLTTSNTLAYSDIQLVPYFLSFSILILIFIVIVFNINFVKFIIFIEVILLLIIIWLVFSSYFFSDLSAWVFITFLLGIYASETAVGLSLYISDNVNKKLKFNG